MAYCFTRMLKKPKKESHPHYRKRTFFLCFFQSKKPQGPREETQYAPSGDSVAYHQRKVIHVCAL